MKILNVNEMSDKERLYVFGKTSVDVINHLNMKQLYAMFDTDVNQWCFSGNLGSFNK